MKQEPVLWIASRAIGHCYALGIKPHPALCCALDGAGVSVDGYVIGFSTSAEDLEALRQIMAESGYVAHWDG